MPQSPPAPESALSLRDFQYAPKQVVLIPTDEGQAGFIVLMTDPNWNKPGTGLVWLATVHTHEASTGFVYNPGRPGMYVIDFALGFGPPELAALQGWAAANLPGLPRPPIVVKPGP